MGQIVTVMNMKGGVGKTVLAAHLAGVLPRAPLGGKYRRVLAIDYDPQFNLSQMFLPSKTYFQLEEARHTSYAILQDDDTQQEPFQLKVPGNHRPPSVSSLAHSLFRGAKGGQLDLIPSTLDLMYLALGQLRAKTTVFEERFSKFIDECRQKYDVTVIDCHPAGSLLTRTALQNSNHVLIPVVPTSPFAARGVGLMKTFLEDLRSDATPHIVFNLWAAPATKYEIDIRQDAKYKNHCLVETLRKAKALADPTEGKGFVWGGGKPYSRRALLNLIALGNEIVTRLSL